jgi:putative redox protein
MATAGPMKSVTNWKNGVVFEHVSGSAVPYLTDAVLPGEAEHDRAGPTPMELILGSVAGCSGVDLVGIFRKMRLELVSLRITVEGDRIAEHPRIFRSVKMIFEIETNPPDIKRVVRAVELSATKYCSATAVVAHSADVTYSVRHAGEEHHGRIPPPAAGRESGEASGDA